MNPNIVNAYPVAYRRRGGGEQILVVLNPSGKEVKMPYNGTGGQVLYSLNGSAVVENGFLTLHPGGASVVLEKRNCE